MTTTLVNAATAQGYIESTSTSYASALNGASLSAMNGDPLQYVGQSRGGGVYYVWQAFLGWTWASDPDSTPVAAYVRLRNNGVAGTAARDLELRQYNWGTSVSAGNYRTRAQLTGLTQRARVAGIHASGVSLIRAGLGGVNLTQLDTSGSLRYVLNSSRNRTGAAPTGLEWQTLRTPSHSAGPGPILYVTSVTKHLLDLSSGAAVQLSDGTHMYLAQTGTAGTSVGLDLVHHDGTTATVAFAGAAVSGRRGAHAYALTRDTDDNVYVINRSGSLNSLNARAFIRSGSSWAPGPIMSAPLPTYDGDINAVVLAWHPQGGTAGTIVALVGHEAGSNSGTQLAYALVSCDALLTGSGAVLRGSGNAEGILVDAAAASGWNNYVNETSTLLDITQAAPGSARGYVTCSAKHQVMGARASQSVGRYVLNPAGTGFSSTARGLDTVSGFAVKDGDAKSRVLPVSDTQFVTVHASNSDDFGLTVKHRQNTGSNAEFVVLADVRLDAEGISTMPPPAELSTSSVWDAIYDPASNLVWVYYLDAGDGRRLLRTHVDLATGQAGRDEVEVAAQLGSAGSTLHAIRVHRGGLAGQQVLISVAEQTSGGGEHRLLTVLDILNLPPLQPRLNPRGNFDARQPAEFTWAFRDPNPGDHQSSYQLQIWEVVGDTLDYDTGKVIGAASADASHEVAANTLVNGQTYRWRVKTWDALNTEGPWSEAATFTTSASGNVTITVPSDDNPPDIVTTDVQIVWEVTGATQDEYRVQVHRTVDETRLSDTGWVESTLTTHLVTGLASEVEHRVEVTVRSAGVESSTGHRLVTPDYSTPEIPILAVVQVTDALGDDDPEAAGGYIRVEIDNPEPGQELSELDGTFETTLEGWEPVGEFVALDRTDEYAFTGDYSARMTVTEAVPEAAMRPAAQWRVPVEGHLRYTVSFQALSPSETDVRAAIDWFTEDGELISSNVSDAPILPGEWEPQELTTSAPADAAWAGYGPAIVAPTDSAILYVDNLVLRSATDVPLPSVNEIWRADVENPTPVRVATVAVGESYRDYLTASGRTYTYFARALAADGATASSAPAEAAVSFHGVWVHWPEDAEGTARRFLFGKAQRTYTERLAQEATFFAGRRAPVAEIGEHREDTFTVVVDVGNGPHAPAQLRALRAVHRGGRPVVVRDNRGRVIVATLDDYSESDQEWGYQVSVVATRVDAATVAGGE